MLAFEIVETLMPFMEALMFFLIFEAFLNRRPGWGVWRYVLGVVVLGCLIMWSNHLFLYTFKNTFLIIGMAMLIAFIFYEGTLITKIFVPLIEIIITVAAEMVVMNMMASIYACSVTDIVTIPEYRFIGILLCKSTGLAICNGIRVKKHKQRMYITGTYWLLYAVLFCIVILVNLLIFRMSYVPTTILYLLLVWWDCSSVPSLYSICMKGKPSKAHSFVDESSMSAILNPKSSTWMKSCSNRKNCVVLGTI